MGEQNWRPISTAPKDGTKVDLWCKGKQVGPHKPAPLRVTNCRWLHDELRPAGWWTSQDWRIDESVITHWMPLPEAPRPDASADRLAQDGDA